MTNIIESAYSDRQIVAWLRGLYTVALADGHYDPEEQELINQIAQDLVDLKNDANSLAKITPEELADRLGKEPKTAENFSKYVFMPKNRPTRQSILIQEDWQNIQHFSKAQMAIIGKKVAVKKLADWHRGMPLVFPKALTPCISFALIKSPAVEKPLIFDW